jgi:L-ascorbate metabolism protein UlaG (beta-lactamase superfamily)
VVVTDPTFRSRIFHLRRSAPVDPAALGALGGVLVSHVHYDHLDLPSLDRLGRAVPLVVPLGAGALLRRRGFADVREVEVGDELDLGPLRIRATHAEHPTSRRPGIGRTAALGFVLAGTRTIYFAGDTDLFEGMAELAPLDVALLPISGWGPSLPPGHLGPQQAAEALALLQPRVAIPIHWGTYAPWRPADTDDRVARAFVEAAALEAPSVEVRVLRPGESSRLG